MFIQITILVSETGVGTFLLMVSSPCVSRVAYALPLYHLPEKQMLQAMIWIWTVAQGISGSLEVGWFVYYPGYLFAVSFVLMVYIYLVVGFTHTTAHGTGHVCGGQKTTCRSWFPPSVIWALQLRLRSSAMPFFAETTYWSIKKSLKTYFA